MTFILPAGKMNWKMNWLWLSKGDQVYHEVRCSRRVARGRQKGYVIEEACSIGVKRYRICIYEYY